jgi:predicted O-methyltransferase YrrM
MRKWWQPSTTSEIIALPWLAPQVIEKLESIVTYKSRVIEHGSGGSTLWLAERAMSVISFESNDKWRDKINQALENHAVAMVTSDITEIHTEGTEKFDLLLIDGEPVTNRRLWIRKAIELVKPGGWVVLDNANRPEYADDRAWLQKKAAKFETINANEEGTRYLVTEFYRMR